jgi:hypothetical protein
MWALLIMFPPFTRQNSALNNPLNYQHSLLILTSADGKISGLEIESLDCWRNIRGLPQEKHGWQNSFKTASTLIRGSKFRFVALLFLFLAGTDGFARGVSDGGRLFFFSPFFQRRYNLATRSCY